MLTSSIDPHWPNLKPSVFNRKQTLKELTPLPAIFPVFFKYRLSQNGIFVNQNLREKPDAYHHGITK